VHKDDGRQEVVRIRQEDAREDLRLLGDQGSGVAADVEEADDRCELGKTAQRLERRNDGPGKHTLRRGQEHDPADAVVWGQAAAGARTGRQLLVVCCPVPESVGQLSQPQ
jgi:hypothetical protein